jgi:hypothetical protein
MNEQRDSAPRTIRPVRSMFGEKNRFINVAVL